MCYSTDLIELFNNKLDLSVTGSVAGMQLLQEVSNVSFDDLLTLIDSFDTSTMLSSYDVPQFSNIDAIDRVAVIFVSSGLPSFKAEQLGYYLLHHDDATPEANRKYGENHGKAADLLGLACFAKDYFPSVLTAAYISIKPLSLQTEIRAKLLLRLKVVQYLLQRSKCEYINGYDCLRHLARSTMVRRGQSLRRIFQVLASRGNISLQQRANNIYWEE